MRIARTLILALAVVAVATAASAQVPFINVYFDQYGTIETAICPGPVQQTLYVFAQNLNDFATGFEYQIIYPPAMVWLADTNTQPVTVGISPTGISTAFAIPQNGFSPILIHTVEILWNCTNCGGGQEEILVTGNPLTGQATPVYTSWPTFALLQVVGLNSLVCPTVPTEETSWGKVKALYQ